MYYLVHLNYVLVHLNEKGWVHQCKQCEISVWSPGAGKLRPNRGNASKYCKGVPNKVTTQFWNAILKELKYQLFFQKEPLRELNFIHNSTVVKQPFNGNTLAWFCTPLRINAFILRLTPFSDILALQADKSPFNWINPHLACSLCEGASLSIISSLPLVISLGVFGQQIHKSIMVLSFMPWFTQLIPPGLQRSLKRVGRR